MFGFIRVAAVTPKIRIADPGWNKGEILRLMRDAAAMGADAAVFPELCISSASCGDLFFEDGLCDAAVAALCYLAENSGDMLTFVGLPLRIGDSLYNCAAALYQGRIIGLIPKSKLDRVQGEERWFSPLASLCAGGIIINGETVPLGSILFCTGTVVIGVEIGCDRRGIVPVSSGLSLAGANLIVNLDAENVTAGEMRQAEAETAALSRSLNAAYVLAGAGADESTCERVYAGRRVFATDGKTLYSGCDTEAEIVMRDLDIDLVNARRRRSTDFRDANVSLPRIGLGREPRHKDKLLCELPRLPFVQDGCDYLADVLTLQALGLRKKLSATGIGKCVVGVSGGLDSALALISLVVCYDGLGLPRENITAITSPGFGTTDKTYGNALALMKGLGVTSREISIKEACLRHFADIGLEENDRSAAYENAQARERMQILMDVANMEGGLVIGTGDLSEIALGFSTYNGDQMSMYNPNGNIPKTLIRPLLKHAAEHLFPELAACLNAVCDTEISPELLPPDKDGNISQITEQVVGSYELNDFFLYHKLQGAYDDDKLEYLAAQTFGADYSPAEISTRLKQFNRRFRASQFKRTASPDSPQVLSVSLSARQGFRMSGDVVNIL